MQWQQRPSSLCSCQNNNRKDTDTILHVCTLFCGVLLSASSLQILTGLEISWDLQISASECSEDHAILTMETMGWSRSFLLSEWIDSDPDENHMTQILEIHDQLGVLLLEHLCRQLLPTTWTAYLILAESGGGSLIDLSLLDHIVFHFVEFWATNCVRKCLENL